MMSLKEMLIKTALYDGVGVKVTDKSGTFYYFYENFSDNNHGVDRAFRHFCHGETVDIFPRNKCRMLLFKEYMIEYRNALRQVDEADKEFTLNPHNVNASQVFANAHVKEASMMITLCRRLMHWTGCSFRSAKRQIATGNVDYEAFN